MKNPRLLFFALFTTLFVVIFNYTLTLMASVYIASELGSSTSVAIYTVAFYGIGNALGVPLGGALADRIGTVRLLVTCLFLLAFFSFICAHATYFPEFVFYRFMQGFVSGPFYTLVNRLFAVFTPKGKKTMFTSILLMIFAIGPVIGATWGGWIGYDNEWRLLFYFLLPLVLALAFYFLFFLRTYELQLKNTPFDGVGYITFFVGVFLISFALTTGQEFDWFRSPLIVNCFVVGFTSLLIFIIWEINHPFPAVDIKLLKHPIFTFAMINLSILFSSYFGMVILLSFWLNLYVDYTPDWISLLLGTMAVAGLLPPVMIREGFAKTDCRLPLLLSIILFIISCFHTMYFNVDINFERIAFSRILAGFALAFFLPPIVRLAFHTFPEEKSVDTVIVFQVIRALSSGLGAPLYITLWERRQVFYHERLGSTLTAFSQNTKTFFDKAKEIYIQGKMADAQLEYFLQRQATSLALDDCFFLMACILISLMVLFAFTVGFRSSHFYPEKEKQNRMISLRSDK